MYRTYEILLRLGLLRWIRSFSWRMVATSSSLSRQTASTRLRSLRPFLPGRSRRCRLRRWNRRSRLHWSCQKKCFFLLRWYWCVILLFQGDPGTLWKRSCCCSGYLQTTPKENLRNLSVMKTKYLAFSLDEHADIIWAFIRSINHFFVFVFVVFTGFWPLWIGCFLRGKILGSDGLSMLFNDS